MKTPRRHRRNPEGNPQDAVYYQHGCRFVISLPDGRTVYARTEQAAHRQNGEVQELWQDGDQIMRTQQSIGEQPLPEPEALPYPVGFSWESPNWGRPSNLCRVCEIAHHPESLRICVQTDDSRYPEWLSPERLAQRISVAAANIISWNEFLEKQRLLQREQDALAAERADIDGFADDLTPMRRGKIIEALAVQMTLNRGSVKSRRDHIRDLLAKGYKVVHDPRRGRILQTDQGDFWFEKELTKTALDYAAFLLNKADQ